MARITTVTILTAESGLTHYFEQIRRFPMLEPQDEYMFATCWREHGDRDAAHRLVTSHLRLVAKIAMGGARLREGAEGGQEPRRAVRNFGTPVGALAAKSSPAMGGHWPMALTVMRVRSL
jgi:hypothetical protein